ncbi:protein prenyltransferase alpha subunit repeat-containing protein 1 isoform X2 [Mangifera indica]|uniref:protein prenyltransferase alpha subunit repeat-containing protein 1 isoform X2 n=1 Tax=Mangifera indica TaxID=29780 RepID=UPI001CFA9D1E|nr:protein prenyltransferase alpha subunit repeat-containing protein 1 isoform X2 [Mangifera indica]
MSEKSNSEAFASDLLKQFLYILESDPLIDEVGFIHPSQFAALKEEAGGSLSSSGGGASQSQNALNNEITDFWIRDHKLGISTQIVISLYKAAKNAFMDLHRQYKTSNNETLENVVMIHSRALLLLSCDFGTAWNSRKLIASKKQLLPIFMDELRLSALVLSYSPKSEQAWSHRRWVINMLSGRCSTLQDIIERESELVEKFAEKSKMNYRAWNHRCWLVSYMTREQVLHELKRSRNWAGLHIADNSCFHYRRKLMLRNFEGLHHFQENDSFGYSAKAYQVWKALWLHRRFLCLYWMRYLAANLLGISGQSEPRCSIDNDIKSFLDHEFCLLDSCSTVPDDDFEDFQAQAIHSASYMLWLTKHIPKSQGIDLQDKLSDLLRVLNKVCPERSSLWDYLVKNHCE